MVAAVIAVAFSCNSKTKTSEETAAKDSTTTTVKTDSTVKATQDTVKAK